MQAGEQVAGRFTVERLAGAGGMGSVYRAHDQHTGEPVALKLLHGNQPEIAARFQRESRVLAELRHPAIVRHVAHGATADGRSYLAMEWLDGEDLATRLKRAPLSPSESIEMIARAADALAMAHARHVVHRDVQPSNLFLPDRDPTRVKLLDFGLARVADATQALTRTGGLLGTPAYMSPEQAKGDREIGPASDVFSLAAVLFHCLAGRVPFPAKHIFATLTKIVFEEAPRLSSVRSGFPPALDDLVARMMAKQAADRPTAEEAREALLTASPGKAVSLAPASAEPKALSQTEQRLLAVIIARLAAEGDPDTLVDTGPFDMTVADNRTPHARATAKPPGEATESARPIADPFQSLREIAKPFGARVERILDGSIVAMLSGGRATDLAVRAVRCALEIRGLLPDAAIALATGRAVLTGQFPVGEAIDRGAELLSQPDVSIRIDDLTAGLLPPRFEVRRSGSGFELVAEQEATPAERLFLGKPTTCVGRERELAVLRGVFDECAQEKIPGAVLITGEAGIGKSRVRYELVRRLEADHEQVRVLLGRGDPMSAGAPFALISQALRRAMGIREGEPLDQRREKLRLSVAQHVPVEEQARVAEFLGELVGTPFEDTDSVQLRAARQDARLMGDQMQRAWEDWLAAESAMQPLLLVLEDLHWGDLPTVRATDAALRNLRDRPFMVMALARPAVHDLFPDLWSERSVQVVPLPGLRPRACEDLVREVLGDEVSAETVQQVVLRASGNAFFLEELVRAAAEGGEDELPETVLVMIQSRLDALPVDARRVLRAASVFGQVFWAGGVGALLGRQGAAHEAEAPEWLAALESRELVQRRADSKFPGETEFIFRHDLYREAAYATLTEDDRAVGHELAGQWLEQAGEVEAFVLAEHFERGRAMKRAVRWYRRAAEQALEGNDLETAFERAERGLTCGATGETRTALLWLQAEVRNWLGQHADAIRYAVEVMREAPPGSDLACSAARAIASSAAAVGERGVLASVATSLLAGADPVHPSEAQVGALANVAACLFVVGEREPADKLLRRVAGVDHEELPPWAVASVFYACAMEAATGGDLVAFTQLAGATASSYEQAGDHRRACAFRGNLGHGYLELGAFEKAAEVFREVLFEAARSGIGDVALWARHNLGIARSAQGATEEAIELLSETNETAARRGNRLLEGAGRTRLAFALASASQLEEALREAKAAVEILDFSPPKLALALAALAHVLLARRAADEALTAARKGMEILSRTPLDEGELTLRLVFAEALHATGDRSAAAAELRAARDLLRARADKITDAELRAGYLENIWENTRIVALAHEWLDETDSAAPAES